MAWEELFSSPLVLNRLGDGPLDSQLDGYYQWLNELGFARETIRKHISRLSHFSRYLKQLGIHYSNLNSEHILVVFSLIIFLDASTDVQGKNNIVE